MHNFCVVFSLVFNPQAHGRREWNTCFVPTILSALLLTMSALAAGYTEYTDHAIISSECHLWLHQMLFSACCEPTCELCARHGANNTRKQFSSTKIDVDVDLLVVKFVALE